MPTTSNAATVPHVVVVGAGFGGLRVARNLRRLARQGEVAVTVVDRHNYHTFQPLLYQVATAGLDPQDIGHAVRGILQGRSNVSFRLGEVTGLDREARQLELADGSRLAYDHVVLAVGASTADYGIPGVAEHGLPLKSIPEAMRLRDHILSRFERATAAGEVEDEDLTFVIAGGGPTGVELAGALAELADKVLRKDYPSLDLDRFRVVLVERDEDLLTAYKPRLRAYAAEALAERGVEVRLGVAITSADADAVTLSDGSSIPTRTLVWTAGVRANPLADALGLEQTRGGRVVVGPDLRVPGEEDVWVIGDLAGASDDEGALYPQLAPVAIQQGSHAAEQIARTLRGLDTEPFRYVDKGSMATIGRNDAVLELPTGLTMKGFPAWVGWLGLHLVYLIGFRNRVSVLVNWAWNYLTFDRAARLILGDIADLEAERVEPAERELRSA